MNKNIRSLKKNLFVTLTFLLSATFTTNAMTTVVMKKTDPISPLTANMTSLFSPESPPAAIAENTSGAPFPSASKVTPAIDSEHLNFSDIASKAGDK